MINGTSVTDALTFDVENHWTLIDRMEPPVDGGWFGMLIRSRTSAESDGWTAARWGRSPDPQAGYRRVYDMGDPQIAQRESRR